MIQETYKDKFEVEIIQLQQKLETLKVFLDSVLFQTLSKPQRSLLKIQYYSMQTYLQCLKERKDW